MFHFLFYVSRNNIAIIPQDPFLFTGTIRDNMDPYREYSDDKIWTAISKVKIRSVVPSLEAAVTESGIGFSVGQKQLICLARAALRSNKILILDEATANIDTGTEVLLNDLLEEVFAECTILIIAHRLDYIRKCDKVIVLDSGKIVEYGHPSVLLEQKGSFYKMCSNC